MSPISSTNISLPIELYPWLKYGDDSNTTTLPFLTKDIAKLEEKY